MIHFDLPKEKSSIIKVIGIGGGGSNAVNHMFSQDIKGVDFIICNTDSQAIASSAVPNKVQLGPHLTQGLGAGANPEIGRQATEESFEELKKILEVNTKMAFVTAGMGGGTGTGGAPIVSKICRELGILTVGIVTTPFSYEGKRRMQQADEGIQNLKKYVDTLLIISNDKLRQQFGNLPFKAAFAKADNILATAAKCITDVINQHGHINVDFADVCTAMRNGGVAILGSATAEGENRAQKAIENALTSPLLNDNNIHGAKWILLNITSSEGEHEHTIDEMDTIQAFIQHQAGEDCDVILGVGYDNSLGDKLGVTIIATGFEENPIELNKPDKQEQVKEEPKIVMQLGKSDEEKKMYNQPTLDFREEDEMAPQLIDPHKQVVANTGHATEQPKEEAPLQLRPEPKKESCPEKPAEEPLPYSGGYLSRPAHIYAEPAAPSKESPSSTPAEETEMKLVVKAAEPASEPVQETPAPILSRQPEPEDEAATAQESEEQKRKAAERINRLRNMSFNVKNMENPQEIESVPAYIRRNVPLNDQQDDITDSPYSNYTVSQSPEGKQAEISTINTFLDGKKPD